MMQKEKKRLEGGEKRGMRRKEESGERSGGVMMSMFAP